MANPMYGQNKYDSAAEEQKIEHLDRVHLMNVAADNLDLSSAPEGNKVVIITAAQADGTYLQLPEATTTNAGMHIRVVFGIAVADDFAVGCVTSNLIGGAWCIGDTNEAASAANASFMLSKSKSSTDTLSGLTPVGTTGPPAGDRDPPNESNS